MLSESELNSPSHIANVKEFWKFQKIQIGIPFIDSQHAWLISLILRLNSVIKTSPNEKLQSDFEEAIYQVFDYAKSHFHAEELFLNSFSVPNRDKHVLEHHAFIKSIERIVDKSKNVDRLSAVRLYRYLRQWVTHHILKEDKSYGDYLQKGNFKTEKFFQEHAMEGVFILTDEQVDLFSKIRDEDTRQAVDYEAILHDRIADIWKRFKLKLDIPLLDIQHLWLIHLVFQIEQLLHEPPNKRQRMLDQSLNELMRYITEHFATEEYLMEKMNYPQFHAHKNIHIQFAELMHERKHEIDSGHERAVNQLAIEVKEWLFSHIAIEDKKFTRLMKENHDEGIRLAKLVIHDGKAHVKKEQLELYKNIVIGI